MDAKNAIDSFLQDSTGGKAGGRHQFSLSKKSFIASDTAKALREQWNGAGRDNASILLKLTESDGSNPHYVTGWDGKDTFVCFTETGLSYVPYRKLQGMKLDESWEPKTRLVSLRAPVLQENMERGDVHMLLDRVRKTLMKSGKGRRPTRFKNMAKFFESGDEPGEQVEVDSEGKSPPKSAKGSTISTEMVPAPKPSQEIPDEPPGRDKFLKTGKKADKKAESVAHNWRNIDESGKIARRPINHPMMKSKDRATKIGAHGETEQSVSTRVEDTDPQMDKRNQVKLNSEGGKNQGSSGGDGNKTDLQLDKREKVDLRMEDTACGSCDFKGKMRSYDGASVTCPECGARQTVKVRTEEKEADKLKGKNLFGGNKGPGPKPGLFGAKKPLLMIMLMKKVKGAPKKPMSESIFDGICTISENSGHRFFSDPSHATKHGAKFLANIERMKKGDIRRRKKSVG